MNNTTFLLVEQNKPLELTNIYDSSDAIAYIVVVIFWYSSCILFLLRMQMIPSAGVVEHSSKYSNSLLDRRLREKNDNKQILDEQIKKKHELADKERRDKLWDIYFNRSKNTNNKLTRGEPCRIRNIQRRLATIDQCDQDFNERVQFFHKRNSLAAQYTSSNRSKSRMEKRSDTRHRSCIDPRSFEERRNTIDNFKLDEKYPRAVQKLVKRRQYASNSDRGLSNEPST
ncbi:unnamed protein product [Rotaria magnacalcarata]|uniref:Uncharacterized protein n=1 Tax=Rotaria magnacalcarata TaxID=392030 RepID=A0A814ZSH1_9BILA|nr:unnamed protein product [Rotaria magnacalcarata]CAF3953184.1 unnamed protein product [Rotaria magnacalcarata]CAF4649991.1 unnamed protein product [Rotaria magnacalcarata]CAF5210076.1 unnamed protein product [Rotaria magnacalcarata]